MASCITSSWANLAPQARVTVWIDSQTGSTAKLGWTLEYVAVEAASTSASKSYTVKIAGQIEGNGTYNINGKSGIYQISSGYVEIPKTASAKTITFSVSFAFNLTWDGVYAGTKSASGSLSIPAKTSYTIKYDANGGTGAPSEQTKFHGESVLLSSVTPARSGYSFKNWLSTAQNQTYNPSTYYGHDESTTMKAQWVANTYAVTYNANGGTGAPSSQTKTHGVALTLSKVEPTRTNYKFLGWATSKNATVAVYQPGELYASNAAVTLYAVWQLTGQKPRINNLQVSRCTANGSKSDSGTYAFISFGWQSDYPPSIVINAVSQDETIQLDSTLHTGTSGSYSEVFGNGQLSAEVSHRIQITITDSIGETPATATLPSKAFAFDALAGNKGVAFGKPASRAGYADFGFTIADKFGLDVCNGLAAYNGGGDSGIDPDTTLEELCLTSHSNAPQGLGTFYYIKTNFYNTKSETAQRAQIAIPYKKSGSLYHRYYENGAWSAWARYMTADEIYPVGSVVIRYDTTSPATLYGGTWQRIEGRMLFGCATTGTVGATGTHTTGSGSSSLPYVNVAVWRRTA